RVRNEGRVIVAIEIAAVGKFHVHRSDDRERNALDTDRFADSRFAAKEFFTKPCTKKNYAPAFCDIFRTNPSTVSRDFVSHFPVLRINTAHRTIRESFAISNTLETNRLPRDPLNQRRLRFHPFRVLRFKADRLAGSLASCLLACGAGPRNNCTFAEHFERVHQNASKSRSVRKQKRNRNYAPRNPRHRQKTSDRISSQRDPRLLEDLF